MVGCAPINMGRGLPALYNENDPYAAEWLVNLERA